MCVVVSMRRQLSFCFFFQFYFSCLYVSLVCLTVDVCDLLVLMYGCGFFYVQFFAGSWYVCFFSIIKLAIILLIQSLLFYPLPGTEELYARSWRGLKGCQTCYCKCGCMYVYVFPMWITGNKRDVFFGSTCFCSFFCWRGCWIMNLSKKERIFCPMFTPFEGIFSVIFTVLGIC